ncbi:hypothetical protein NPIL_431101 [Nephila pilipes]|uniref:DDE Tnp4 domain-containing protein n=1 Tax=Nephila pilipes TaxID=299642 RepID=A0A8X6IY73_NEPPI|nr:hypothetical protein NPIL_431101 [Nephila pilipes]
MDHLEPNDVVMDDKGFLIAEELESIGNTLQGSIFLKNKIQFDVSEMVSNFKLPNMRVTVENDTSRDCLHRLSLDALLQCAKSRKGMNKRKVKVEDLNIENLSIQSDENPSKKMRVNGRYNLHQQVPEQIKDPDGSSTFSTYLPPKINHKLSPSSPDAWILKFSLLRCKQDAPRDSDYDASASDSD